MKKGDVVGYTSKAGKKANYRIIAFWKKGDQDRVRLQSFGKKPVEFWVDKEKIETPNPIKAKPGAEVRVCWECGCGFTWADAKNNGGDWSNDYCGC